MDEINLPIKHESKPYLMIPLPDNATNGDMIKALFPAIETTDFYMTVHATTKVESDGVKGGISFDFWKEWWYAPYKAESDIEKRKEWSHKPCINYEDGCEEWTAGCPCVYYKAESEDKG